MSTHNICFHGKIRKLLILILFFSRTVQTNLCTHTVWSAVFVLDDLMLFCYLKGMAVPPKRTLSDMEILASL